MTNTLQVANKQTTEYTVQHRSVLLIFPLIFPTIIVVQMRSTTTITTTKNVSIIVLPSHIAGHFTKFIQKTAVPLNVDASWWSEWTAPSQPYDWR